MQYGRLDVSVVRQMRYRCNMAEKLYNVSYNLLLYTKLDIVDEKVPPFPLPQFCSGVVEH